MRISFHKVSDDSVSSLPVPPSYLAYSDSEEIINAIQNLMGDYDIDKIWTRDDDGEIDFYWTRDGARMV